MSNDKLFDDLTDEQKRWREWGRRDYVDLGRHCASIRSGQIRHDLARAYKEGYQEMRETLRHALRGTA